MRTSCPGCGGILNIDEELCGRESKGNLGNERTLLIELFGGLTSLYLSHPETKVNIFILGDCSLHCTLPLKPRLQQLEMIWNSSVVHLIWVTWHQACARFESRYAVSDVCGPQRVRGAQGNDDRKG